MMDKNCQITNELICHMKTSKKKSLKIQVHSSSVKIYVYLLFSMEYATQYFINISRNLDVLIMNICSHSFYISMTLTKKLATSVMMFALLAVFAAPTVSFADHGSTSHVLTGVAFDDANNNGIFDCNENGIQGVTINLLADTIVVIDTATTDVDGTFVTSGVVDGTYALEIFSSPTGVTFDENFQAFVMNSDRTVYFGSPSGSAAASCDGDITPPVITVTPNSDGNVDFDLLVGETYVEFGATATDDVDGSIDSGDITITGLVDTTSNGQYTITYTVSDAAQNEASESRIVTVLTQQEALDKIELEINAIPDGDIGNNANGLLLKLDQIMNKLDANNTNAACNQLNAFIIQVDGLIISGNLSSEVGQPILDAAIGIQSNYC
jgi:hypothetical protein